MNPTTNGQSGAAMQTTQQPLTKRQWQVLAIAARGAGYREIGRRLRISPYTVDSHLETLSGIFGTTQLPVFVDRAYRQGLLAGLQPEVRAYRKLPRRRQQVLEGLACGRTHAELAAEMFVSEDTVHSHVKLLFQDLGARNRWHAVALGHQLGHLGNR